MTGLLGATQATDTALWPSITAPFQLSFSKPRNELKFLTSSPQPNSVPSSPPNWWSGRTRCLLLTAPEHRVKSSPSTPTLPHPPPFSLPPVKAARHRPSPLLALIRVSGCNKNNRHTTRQGHRLDSTDPGRLVLPTRLRRRGRRIRMRI